MTYLTMCWRCLCCRRSTDWVISPYPSSTYYSNMLDLVMQARGITNFSLFLDLLWCGQHLAQWH